MTFVFPETWALAGVTVNLGGTIKDPSGAPIDLVAPTPRPRRNEIHGAAGPCRQAPGSS
ncbi:MAG: hypothetical protein WAL67_09965 [Candidatus Cybelea sp.]